MKTEKKFNIGIDIGSTTIKIIALNYENREIIFESYERHNGAYYPTLLKQLESLKSISDSTPIQIAVTGSQGTEIAKTIEAVFIQEVIAQAIAVRNLYPHTKTSIELGGQDAKMVFYSEHSGTTVTDMRMNGVCAGGTGAFIDQIATLLGIPIEKFNEAAARGTKVYDISGRCGVFAKTDIQPLLNQGVCSEDIALSSLHALAKQT
ncbi:MAG: 2-hydroxyglutaryl-CoA dehydratase, partial [Chitinispirillaceae bacterium]|nr:2-hydroxyglutaryl-CoA dehydratase [Chitinispirillaceae bacterium]